ncbi:MAG TPA: bacillithiol biosynthesis BshC, partial [Chitinophagaceae bacterium]|nr:bacillithiol biosynthesis BshC [Chitinophagaceae bacterium]
MDCISTRLPYRQTGAFSKIALDYIDQDARLKPFIANPPTLRGFEKAIEQRKTFSTNRDILVTALKKQYAAHNPHEAVSRNIDALASSNSFTITTAHQNNLFTGPLYFIYKILHVIRLSEYLTSSMPSYKFIPVFYMGTEDADLDELNHIYLDKEKLVWQTRQTGAVG